MHVFRSGWFLFICIAVLVAANVSLYRAMFAPRVLEVSVLNVGKGSATLVRTPGGMTVLVNTGPDASILRALGTALSPWQRRIDAVVLTGTKASLVGGLPEVESRYRVSTVVRVGTTAVPYGASITFDGSRIEIISPEAFSISYGTTSLPISSTTPAGVYVSNGAMVAQTK